MVSEAVQPSTIMVKGKALLRTMQVVQSSNARAITDESKGIEGVYPEMLLPIGRAASASGQAGRWLMTRIRGGAAEVAEAKTARAVAGLPGRVLSRINVSSKGWRTLQLVISQESPMPVSSRSPSRNSGRC